MVVRFRSSVSLHLMYRLQRPKSEDQDTYADGDVLCIQATVFDIHETGALCIWSPKYGGWRENEVVWNRFASARN